MWKSAEVENGGRGKDGRVLNRPHSNVSRKQAQSQMGSQAEVNRPVLLFDGVCNLCNGAVRFIIRRDRRGNIHFAPFQWEGLTRFMKSRGIDAHAVLSGNPPGNIFEDLADNPSSVLLIVGGHVYDKSDAVLRAARYLQGAWPLLCVFRIVPRPLRDAVYDWIARNRIRWFGRLDACMVPTADIRSRFLNGSDAGKGENGVGRCQGDSESE